MPAVARAVNLLARTILHARQTPDLSGPLPFPPSRKTNVDDDDNGIDDGTPGPFPFVSDDDQDGESLSPKIIAAIVISIILFVIVLIGLFALFNHRRRQARKAASVEEIAMKEEVTSATTTPASVAIDPPPPYEGGYFGNPSQSALSIHPDQGQSWDSPSRSVIGVSQEEDSDAMGSHATVTDGLAPERHNDSRPAGC